MEALTDHYAAVKMKYQVANVTKALCSVGQVCDQGNVLVFTQSGGFIHNMASKRNTKFAREGKMYVLNTWVKRHPQENRPVAPF